MIVKIGSVNAFLPDPPVVDYSAAKAALVNLAKSWSKDFGPRGIGINTIDPGPVETDMWLGSGGVAQTVAGANGQQPGDVVANAVAGTATGRFTRPAEVADLVVLLASDRRANVTGTTVYIDGCLISTI